MYWYNWPVEYILLGEKRYEQISGKWKTYVDSVILCRQAGRRTVRSVTRPKKLFVRGHPQITMVFKAMKHLMMILISFLLIACADITPALFELQRGDTTLYLFGTIHLMTPEDAQRLESMPRYVRSAFDSSDIVFVESVPIESQQEFDEHHSIIVGGPERPSVREMVESWEADRRDRFVSSFIGFPGHGRAEAERLLEYRPFAVQWHVSALLDRAARIDATQSVESWLIDRAERRQIPIYILETAVEFDRAFDSHPQEGFLLAVEDIVALNPTRTQIARARRAQLEAIFERWSNADTIRAPEQVLARELGAGPDTFAFVEMDEQDRYLLYEGRERKWMERLESVIGQYERTDSTLTVFVSMGFSHIEMDDGGTFLSDMQDSGWELVRRWP